MKSEDIKKLKDAISAKDENAIADVLSRFSNDELGATPENVWLEIVKIMKEAQVNRGIFAEVMLYAVQYDHVNVLKYLIDNKFINPAEYESPVVLAAKKGDIDMVKLLCSNGADVNAAAKSAILAGHTHILDYLYKSHKITFSLEELNSLVGVGFINVFKFLKDHEVPIAVFDMDQNKLDKHYHIVDFVETNGGKHIHGRNPEHDAYKAKEDKLLKNVNPLVYNVNLGDVDGYASVKGEILMSIFKRRGMAELPNDLHGIISSGFSTRYNISSFDITTALKLNFPTQEEIEKVDLKCSPQAKAWIALLEKNQISEVLKS